MWANDIMYIRFVFYCYVLIPLLFMTAEIDLANLNGQVMNLPHHQSVVASDVLGQREDYILVSIHRKEIENLYKVLITLMSQLC